MTETHTSYTDEIAWFPSANALRDPLGINLLMWVDSLSRWNMLYLRRGAAVGRRGCRGSPGAAPPRSRQSRPPRSRRRRLLPRRHGRRRRSGRRGRRLGRVGWLRTGRSRLGRSGQAPAVLTGLLGRRAATGGFPAAACAAAGGANAAGSLAASGAALGCCRRAAAPRVALPSTGHPHVSVHLSLLATGHQVPHRLPQCLTVSETV